MRNHEHTAGTAGAGYRAVTELHPFEADVWEYGRRPTCRRCGEERSRHETARAEAGR